MTPSARGSRRCNIATIAMFTVLAACEFTPPAPVLTECDRFFLRVLEDECAEVKKTEVTCDSLDCSQTALVFDVRCQDPDACCTYRDCWGVYEDCMKDCDGESDFDSCLDDLGKCVGSGY